jgi:hypothetical protein
MGLFFLEYAGDCKDAKLIIFDEFIRLRVKLL